MPKRRDERGAAEVLDAPEATVLDALDRLLTKGAVLDADVALGLAGVDLIYLRLSALLGAADRLLPALPRATRPSTRSGRPKPVEGRSRRIRTVQRSRRRSRR
jgi:hypothetical protein